MVNSKTRTPSISFIYKKISDDKALSLFNSIAMSNGDRYVQLREMNLTTKQYYTRLSGLVNAGLIKRVSGKYSLTLVGKIVYDAHLKIGKALSYYWKLKAIESIETSAISGNELLEQELTQLINTLIDNKHIKDILMKSMSVRSTEGRSKTPTLSSETAIQHTSENIEGSK
jgi:hypothetical protein